jgi:hypothetical protein
LRSAEDEGLLYPNDLLKASLKSKIGVTTMEELLRKIVDA